MKHTVLCRVFALMVGILFSHIACAQQADNLPETDLSVYDEYDTQTLKSYLETSYCPYEISVWGVGGISSLQFRPSFGKTDKGFGGAFGVGYTYFVNKNWGLSSGLEYAFYKQKTAINGFAETNAISDILGNPVTYNTRIDNYSEKQFAGLLNIPLSVQYQTNGKNGKIDPIKTAEIDHLKLCLQKSKKLSVGNGV